MKKPITVTDVFAIGLDIAKLSFAVHGCDASGKGVLKKTLRRGEVLGFFAGLSPTLVGLETCGSANYWAREFAKLGHEVRLIPPARVKLFLERQKNDAGDAKAIAAALMHPETRFVPVRSLDEQARLMLFKARDLLMSQRTQLLNALRGHFAEAGVVAPKGALEAMGLARLAKDEAVKLPAAMRRALLSLVAALEAVMTEIGALSRQIAVAFKNDERAKALAEVPGIGTFSAVALAASVPDFKVFAGGREFAAYLGLVPRQHSTGGKPRLGAITKMGNRDLRKLLYLGAVSALARFRRNAKGGALGDWARALLARKPFRLVAAAFANKLARIVWAVMAKGQIYDARHGLPQA